MRSRSRKMSVLLGVAATTAVSGMAGKVKAASYTVSNSFLLPSSTNTVNYSDGFYGGSLTANYNSSSIVTSAGNATFPQAGGAGVAAGGAMGGSAGIIGTISGTGANTSNAGLAITTGFAYDSTGFHTVGLYSTTSNGSYGTTINVRAINAAGQVIGTSPVNSASNSSSQVLGVTGWLNNDTGAPVAIGLTGAGPNGGSYGYTVGNNLGTYMNTTVQSISSNGYVVGYSTIYSGNSFTTNSTNIGSFGWVFVPTSANSTSGNTIPVGLTGSNYTYTYTGTLAAGGSGSASAYSESISSVVATPNSSAAYEAVGSATPYSTVATASNYYNCTLGNDLFVYSPGSSPTIIGAFNFTSGSVAGYQTQTVVQQNSTSLITYNYSIPAATITPASGSFGSTTFAYGMIPKSGNYYGPNTDPVQSAVKRSNSFTALNSAGQVGFSSTYYINNSSTATGTDAFIYTPGASTPYAQVGLTTDNFAANATSYPAGQVSFVSGTGARTSTIGFLNDSGQSAGTSSAYVGNAAGTGVVQGLQAAWYAPSGGQTVQIGLFNSSLGVHTESNGYFYEAVTAMNKNGLVAGYADRYLPNSTSQNGQDAWVYDPNNINPISGNHMWTVDPNDATLSSTYTSSEIDYLSDNGYAVGDIISTTAAPYQNQGFIWSEANGIQFLDGSLPSNLSGTAYQDIINTFYTDLNGDTVYATTSATGLSGQTGSYPNYVHYNPAALVTLTGSPVPEPASLSLLGMGSVFLLGRRRRRSV